MSAPPRTWIQESTLCSREEASSVQPVLWRPNPWCFTPGCLKHTMEEETSVLLTNREAEAQSSALHSKPQLTAYFLHSSSILCPLRCIDIQQFPNLTSPQSGYMSSEADKKTQPVPSHTFISRHCISPAHVAPQSPHARDRFLLPMPGRTLRRGDNGRRKKDWEHRDRPTKHCVSEECISIASYCLPGTAAGWGHSPSCPEPSPFARRQDRTEWAATLTLCAAQPASCHGSGQTCQTLLPACQRCRGCAAPHLRCSSPGLWERKKGEQATQGSKRKAVGLEGAKWKASIRTS